MAKISTFLDGWYRHRAVLLDVLDRIPDDQVNFQPWKKAMNLGGLAVHTVTSAQMFVSACKTGSVQRPSSGITFDTMEEVRAIVRDLTEQTKTDIESITDEEYEQMIDATQMMGFQAPAKVFLNAMKDHEIHHKGQLYVYARMVGVEQLPMFMRTN